MRARIQRFVKAPGPYRQAQAEEIQYRPYLIDGCLARTGLNDPGNHMHYEFKLLAPSAARFRAGIEDEGVIDPFFGGAGLGPE
jgi:hypothetical protein